MAFILKKSKFPRLVPRYGHQEAMKYMNEVTSWLNETHISYEHVEIRKTPNNVIGLGKLNDGCYKLGLHLLPVPTGTESTHRSLPSLCKKLTDDTKLPFESIVHLHQDIWINKHDIVKARLNAKIGRIKHRWYARQTKAVRIHLSTAMEFLEAHHLWGATRAKFNYGLMIGDTLVAVATFSPRRHVERGYDTNRPFRSHELIRYCSTKDGHVIGGITKLIAAFCRDFAPDDLITCIDRDWGDGKGWESIGFEKVSVMPPLIMSLGQGNSHDHWIRYYLVGAGIGAEAANTSGERKGRPGIGFEIFNELKRTSNANEAKTILEKHGLFPVYDAGVERRMLAIQDTKLEKICRERRKELEIEDLRSKVKSSVLELWQSSSPSFPSQYYSPNNMGINALLEDAASSDEWPLY